MRLSFLRQALSLFLKLVSLDLAADGLRSSSRRHDDAGILVGRGVLLTYSWISLANSSLGWVPFVSTTLALTTWPRISSGAGETAHSST
jgi:hypothetical protein